MNVVNQVAFLRTSREYPEDLHQLTVEVNKSYVDIAGAVNVRTIGLFPAVRPAITGESWFLISQREQTLRQVYTFGVIAAGGTLTIPYTLNGFTQFTRIYGTCLTTVPDARPIPFASVTANANIELRVDIVNFLIIIVNGAAAPQINSGLVVLEWLSPL